MVGKAEQGVGEKVDERLLTPETRARHDRVLNRCSTLAYTLIGLSVLPVPALHFGLTNGITTILAGVFCLVTGIVLACEVESRLYLIESHEVLTRQERRWLTESSVCLYIMVVVSLVCILLGVVDLLKNPLG